MSADNNKGPRGRQDWATPQWLFDALECEFGKFDVDVCAEPWSAKCSTYYAEKMNGLAQDWGGKRFFCNPPFAGIKAWIEKGYQHVLRDGSFGCFILPANTDTAWFHDYAVLGTLLLLRGRVQFDPPPDYQAKKSGNNNGTMVLIYDKSNLVVDRDKNFQAVTTIGWNPPRKKKS